MRGWTRILGIDPGFRVTGYGILDTDGQQSRFVSAGTIAAIKGPTPAGRLQIIFESVQSILATHAPQEMAVESVFVHRNPSSALKLGQARSAAICASFDHNLEVYEYAPREVKQAVVGKGSASKEQVAHMVKVLLNYSGDLPLDASDALGIALCHAHSRNAEQRLAGAAQ